MSFVCVLKSSRHTPKQLSPALHELNVFTCYFLYMQSVYFYQIRGRFTPRVSRGTQIQPLFCKFMSHRVIVEYYRLSVKLSFAITGTSLVSSQTKCHRSIFCCRYGWYILCLSCMGGQALSPYFVHGFGIVCFVHRSTEVQPSTISDNMALTQNKSYKR